MNNRPIYQPLTWRGAEEIDPVAPSATPSAIDEVTDLIYRLRKRAEIRRQIPTRKSVIEGANDRISDLMEEAANMIEALNASNK